MSKQNKCLRVIYVSVSIYIKYFPEVCHYDKGSFVSKSHKLEILTNAKNMYNKYSCLKK